MVVRAEVSDMALIRALNAPGKPVDRLVQKVRRSTLGFAISTAPVNNPLDAVHRDRVVGTYKASFKSDRYGTRGHRVAANVYNTAEHAGIVESGRPSTVGGAEERFYWRKMPRQYLKVDGTSGREGRHILENALMDAVARHGIGIVSGSVRRR